MKQEKTKRERIKISFSSQNIWLAINLMHVRARPKNVFNSSARRETQAATDFPLPPALHSGGNNTDLACSACVIAAKVVTDALAGHSLLPI